MNWRIVLIILILSSITVLFDGCETRCCDDGGTYEVGEPCRECK